MGVCIMKAGKVTNTQIFEGKVVLKNAISVQQRHLFNLHKPNLDRMIKDMPFDLFVEQSKSKKTITLSTNVEGAFSYIVCKNKQNFEEAAQFAISDAASKSKIYKDMVAGNNIFECKKAILINILTGKYKQASEYEKQLAKLGTENFEVYKKIPIVKVKNLPIQIFPTLLKHSFLYRIHRAFSSRIPEEKTFLKMKKEYLKDLKSRGEKMKTFELDFSNYYRY